MPSPRSVRTALAACLLCVVSFGSCVQGQGRSGAIGVLIGLHGSAGGADDGNRTRPNRLRTMWVSAQDSGRLTAVEVPQLLVPRASGFWRVGLASACEEEEMLDFEDKSLGFGATLFDEMWASTLGATQPATDTSGNPTAHASPEAKCRDIAFRCVNDWTTSIYWVWPEYASLELGERGECGMHPDWWPGYTVRSLDALGTPLTMAAAIGLSSQERLQLAFQLEARRDTCDDRPVFDPESWHVVRDRGQWRAVGWSSTHRLCGYGIDYTADVPVTRLTGSIDSRPVYQRLSARRPEIVDAHASPDGRWTLAVVGERLDTGGGRAVMEELLLLDRQSNDRQLWRLRLENYGEPVMVEWALGRHVDRWRQAVARARALPAPDPPVVGVQN